VDGINIVNMVQQAFFYHGAISNHSWEHA
jgi:hypothetical protein